VGLLVVIRSDFLWIQFISAILLSGTMPCLPSFESQLRCYLVFAISPSARHFFW
jgi:hypothetical protein